MPSDTPGPVLVLEGPSRTVVAVARCLARHGIPVDAARFHATAAPGLCSRAIRQGLTLTDYAADSGQCLEELEHLIATRCYSMLIPASDAALVALRAGYERLSKLVRIACPEPHIVNGVLDKSITLRAAAECGIPIPQSWDLGSPDAERRLPLVCKPRSKMASSEFRVKQIRTLQDLRELRKLASGCESDYLLQEYCEGVGVGVEVLIWEGEPVVLFQHRRVKENPAAGGVSVVAESEPLDPLLGDMALRLLRRLEWNGPAMVEFRQDRRTNKLALMEVNGRYWGSLALPCLAGVEFPYYQWQLVHGGQPAVPAHYPVGIRVRWTTSEFLRLKGMAVGWLAGKTGFGALCREGLRFCWELGGGASDAMSVRGDRWPGIAELWFIATRRFWRARTGMPGREGGYTGHSVKRG